MCEFNLKAHQKRIKIFESLKVTDLSRTKIPSFSYPHNYRSNHNRPSSVHSRLDSHPKSNYSKNSTSDFNRHKSNSNNFNNKSNYNNRRTQSGQSNHHQKFASQRRADNIQWTNKIVEDENVPVIDVLAFSNLVVKDEIINNLGKFSKFGQVNLRVLGVSNGLLVQQDCVQFFTI